MSFESLAKLIHLVATNPTEQARIRQVLPSHEIGTGELALIQRVFAKYRMSGDSVAAAAVPDTVYWG